MKAKNIFYSVNDKSKFKGKKVSIFGGDSSFRLDFRIIKISTVTLIHRRDEFRGAPHTLSEIKKIRKSRKIGNQNSNIN